MMSACDGSRRNNKWCRHINGLLLLGGRRRVMSDGTCRLVGSDGGPARGGGEHWNVECLPLVKGSLCLNRLAEGAIALH